LSTDEVGELDELDEVGELDEVEELEDLDDFFFLRALALGYLYQVIITISNKTIARTTK